MYELQIPKLRVVFESPPGSVVAAPAVVKPEPPNTAIVEPDEQ